MKMLKFRQAALALAAAGLLSGQAYAGEAQVQDLSVAQVETIVAQPLAVFTEADVNAMFEQSGEPMQLAVLSQQEMRETEGALAPLFFAGLGSVATWTVGGGAVLGAAHVAHNRGVTSSTWRAVGSGATGGFFASPPVRAVSAARRVPDFARWSVGSVGAASWWQGRR